MKTILVPVDFSAATVRVCDAASALAKLIKARLILLHVVEPPPILLGDAYAYDAGALAAAVTAGEKYATRRLRELGRRYSTRKLAVQTVQLTGRAVAAILAKAAATKADYLVLGSHGHGVAYDLLVGSTAQGVLRKAPCPVLVVPMGRR
jgi:nucleotide-binding universal stress UspA family protein